MSIKFFKKPLNIEISGRSGLFNKYVKLLFFITIFIILQWNILCADKYFVIDVTGKVLLLRNGKSYTSLNEKKVIAEGDLVKTYRDSVIILKDEDNFYKLYPYSTVRIEKAPVLVCGKLSKSGSGNFTGLHFYFTPGPAQGKTMKVVLRSKADDLNVSAYISSEKGYKNKLVFYSLGNGVYRALTGFDVETPPVKYSLKIKIVTKNGNFSEIIYPFYLKKTVYGKGKVYLSKDKVDLLADSEQKREEMRTLSQVLSSWSEEALWEKTFVYPVKDPVIISRFGKKRSYYIKNIFSFTRFHRGSDFKGERGDPVFSPNKGEVVFTGMRITTGNTIVIDHGQGVFSLFFHLDSINVKNGDRVEKSERIGEVGSTGLVEASHLHWGLLVNGVYVDPSDWIRSLF